MSAVILGVVIVATIYGSVTLAWSIARLRLRYWSWSHDQAKARLRLMKRLQASQEVSRYPRESISLMVETELLRRWSNGELSEEELNGALRFVGEVSDGND
jgi:biopolymer transport protein ExbB/TolQ